MLLSDKGDDAESVARGLVEHCEAYLREHGSQLIYGGGMYPINPFYLGLYGGSELPGVLKSDASFTAAIQEAGYTESDRCTILQLQLDGFRPIVNRQQLQVRRNSRLETTFDPPSRNWWEACTNVDAERLRFDLFLADQGDPRAGVTFWNMELFYRRQGQRTFGLTELHVDEPLRRHGYAIFLISEAIKQLAAFGVSSIEVQTMHRNRPALELYTKLGFVEIDEGVVYRR
jgi:ribosomal protein S18 acetylase RimI-like enzyme